MDYIYVANRAGAAWKVKCTRDSWHGIITISAADAKDATTFFDDDDMCCMVAETGRMLDSEPTSSLSGHWYFPPQ
jgi:hypothetical protein